MTKYNIKGICSYDIYRRHKFITLANKDLVNKYGDFLYRNNLYRSV